MRISKAALMSRWAWSTALAGLVFAILFALDLRLKARAGVGTADIQAFTTAAQFRAAFWAWAPEPYALQAGFDLGFDYLLMPLYAVSFFYSGIIAAEVFAPRPGGLRRIVLLAAMVPLAGALCDAAENAVQLYMFFEGATDSLARAAYTLSNAKTMALMVGAILLVAAFAARVSSRRRQEPKITL